MGDPINHHSPLITSHSPPISQGSRPSHGPAHRIPSELRSQPPLGAPSTGVGDHPGTTRADCRLMGDHHNNKEHDWRSRQRVGLIILRSWVRSPHRAGSIGAVGSALVLCANGPGFEPLMEHACVHGPINHNHNQTRSPWPNGYGVRLRISRLRVRVPASLWTLNPTIRVQVPVEPALY